MPPFLPRKRLRSDTPEAGPSKAPPKNKGKAKATPTPRKPTLFDDLDAGTGRKRTIEDGKALLEKMAAVSDDESSLSSLSDDELEDVPAAKRQKLSDSDEEDEDIEFEDVETHAIPRLEGPAPSGDLLLTLTKETRHEITNPYGTKKGPSKIERQIRIATHQMHVQMLMYHNAIRNSWLCDKNLQEILVNQLPKQIIVRVEKWRRDSGLPATKVEEPKGKGKGKAKNVKGKKDDPRSQRDWGEPAQRLAEGEVNMSGGDPLFPMLARLVSYWKQRFRITAPGLRKVGYMSLRRLDEESKSFKEDEYNPERHGERIRDLDEFKECATRMEGSRDVGAQLFTALLRGLGLETRLVASLQPIGFAWSQNEEASKKNPRALKRPKAAGADESSDEDATSDEDEPEAPVKAVKGKSKVAESVKKRKATSRAFDEIVGRSRENKSVEPSAEGTDDDSVIDVTPGRPKVLPSLPYDQDLLFPHYWSEVLSPVTNTYAAVDAVVMRVVAKDEFNLAKFEIRGLKAEKAKQVTAYIVGHSSDGTAKDVTTRYLKRHVWPGRTKGYRLPIEKVPVYDKNGKVKKYEQKDWFKMVMSGYVRGSKKCPRTEIDDHEEMTDLKPAKAEKKVVPAGKETLQYYKSSPDFVLERHLKREEALVANAEHVKMFTIKGKGEDSVEEKVYRRKDVVNCKSMETWHKEGRAPRPDEEPLKRVPYRAATTNRRRELAEAENASGAKVLQGLYSRAQTDWIIPPPIENGIIPKNNFGNIDLYVDSMLPAGAVHLPYRGMVKICKRLNIDYAEAVTGFEFGHRMAVPVITGVVVAEEHEEVIMEEWEKEEVERVRKEDEKRRKVAVHMWRKMLMGMRIIERVREEYGDLDLEGGEVEISPFVNQEAGKEREEKERKEAMNERDEEMGGGFFPEGFDAEEPAQSWAATTSYYPVAHDHENDSEDDEGGGFMVEDHEEAAEPVKMNGFVFASRHSHGVEPDNEDDDVEMQDVQPEISQSKSAAASLPKKRGRSAKAVQKAQPKSTPARKPNGKQKATPVSAKAKVKGKGIGKAKLTIPDSDEDEDSPLSELESDISSLSDAPPDAEPEEEEPEPPKKGRPKKLAPRKTTTTPAKKPAPARGKRKSTAAKGEEERQTPRRASGRVKVIASTGTRSKYFENSGGEDDEDDEEEDEEDGDGEDGEEDEYE